MIFVDSNIPMYVAGREHPNREPALRFLERARAGEIGICSSTEVLQEILYRYTSIERREVGYRVYDLFVALCPVIFSVTLADTDRAKEMLTRVNGPSVRDAVHAAVMLNNDVEEIATFDRGFDSIDGVRRVDLT
jgi:predicted nucleic acid-binding protein